MTADGRVSCGTTIATVRVVPRDSAAARWLGRYPSCSMTFSTDTRVASRTLPAPLMTRETVPTPKPEAAATSAIVARREVLIVLLSNGPVRWNRFHQCELDHRRSASGMPSIRQEAVKKGNARYSTIFEIGISRMSRAPAAFSAGIAR